MENDTAIFYRTFPVRENMFFFSPPVRKQNSEHGFPTATGLRDMSLFEKLTGGHIPKYSEHL